MDQQLINRSIARLKAQWPGSGWSGVMLEDYQRVLRDLEALGVLEEVVDKAIDEWDGRFVPQVAHFRTIGKMVAEKRREPAKQKPVTPTPIVWARLVKGTLFAAMAARGHERFWGEEMVPYVRIAQEHDLGTDDFCWTFGEGTPDEIGMSPTNCSAKVGKAFEEAKRIGDEGEAGADELAGLMAGV